jgi:hypothetical protein
VKTRRGWKCLFVDTVLDRWKAVRRENECQNFFQQQPSFNTVPTCRVLYWQLTTSEILPPVSIIVKVALDGDCLEALTHLIPRRSYSTVSHFLEEYTSHIVSFLLSVPLVLDE